MSQAPIPEDHECIRCHKLLLFDDGTDPTELCHNCAHERVKELEAQVKTLEDALSDSNDNALHKSKWGEYMITDGEWEIRVQELDRTLSALTEQNINLRTQVKTLREITDQVVDIMQTYHEQEKSPYGVDTPGGLEHMGDVWALLDKWARAALAATEPK